MDTDDERGNDQYEQMFFNRNTKEVNARPETDCEDADFERIPVPNVRDWVQNNDSPAGPSESAGPPQEPNRDRSPDDFCHQIGKGAKHADVGKHI